MSDFLCIILFAIIIYLLYFPHDPYGIIKKFRKITLYPVYSTCYHVNDGDMEESKSVTNKNGKPAKKGENNENTNKNDKDGAKSVKRVKKDKNENSITSNTAVGLTPGPGVIVHKEPENIALEESEFLRNSMRKKENRGK
uniref:Exported protein n=1 Tax=Parastrongyloides trichosuri TaxID=131310 RepID=A0A0N4ZNM0_PARTI